MNSTAVLEARLKKQRLFSKLENLTFGAGTFVTGYARVTLYAYCREWANVQPERIKFKLTEVSNGICVKKIKVKK